MLLNFTNLCESNMEDFNVDTGHNNENWNIYAIETNQEVIGVCIGALSNCLNTEDRFFMSCCVPVVDANETPNSSKDPYTNQ